jgi:hypothetical protein
MANSRAKPWADSTALVAQRVSIEVRTRSMAWIAFEVRAFMGGVVRHDLQTIRGLRGRLPVYLSNPLELDLLEVAELSVIL